MSRRNGDRSRFQINRKRKMLLRQRMRALLITVTAQREGTAATDRPAQGSKPPQE